MAIVDDIYKNLHQNLIDAGCDERVTENCMLLAKDGNGVEMLPILKKHRKCLLDLIHKGQRQIDCLDYLIYALQKQK